MLLINRNKPATSLLLLGAVLLLALACSSGSQVDGQQDGDNDDFDDQGFDDSGYNSPQNHDAEGSNQQPRNQSPSDEEDLDDDDDVDETHMRPQLASQAEDQQQEPQQYEPQQRQQNQQDDQQQQPGFYGYPAAASMHQQGPQRFYNSPESMILANIAPMQANANEEQDVYQQQAPQYNRRIRRSIEDNNEQQAATGDGPKQPLNRQKRHSKYIGPVYTYVKTDKYARFKWGVKHKVGKHGK